MDVIQTVPLVDERKTQVMERVRNWEQQDCVALIEDLLNVNGQTVDTIHQLVFNYKIKID